MNYSALVRELFERAPRAGRLRADAAEGAEDRIVRAGRALEPVSGAEIEFSILIENGRIADARFLARGCPHTIAAAALVAGELPGMAPAEVRCDPQALACRLAAPPEKLGRLLAVEDALLACLRRDGTGA